MYNIIEKVRFEVLTRVVMNAEILWDIAPCSQYVNRRTSETLDPIRTTRCCIQEVTTLKKIKFFFTKCRLEGPIQEYACLNGQAGVDLTLHVLYMKLRLKLIFYLTRL
jgi:hypothetical protein